jgi:hypothetical protein
VILADLWNGIGHAQLNPPLVALTGLYRGIAFPVPVAPDDHVAPEKGGLLVLEHGQPPAAHDSRSVVVDKRDGLAGPDFPCVNSAGLTGVARVQDELPLAREKEPCQASDPDLGNLGGGRERWDSGRDRQEERQNQRSKSHPATPARG